MDGGSKSAEAAPDIPDPRGGSTHGCPPAPGVGHPDAK